MIKAWSDDAWDEFIYWQQNDKKVLKRILELIKDIDRNGYEGIGKPERLTGNLKADPFFSQENLKRLEKNAEQMKTTGGQIHEVLND